MVAAAAPAMMFGPMPPIKTIVLNVLAPVTRKANINLLALLLNATCLSLFLLIDMKTYNEAIDLVITPDLVKHYNDAKSSYFWISASTIALVFEMDPNLVHADMMNRVETARKLERAARKKLQQVYRAAAGL